MTERKWIAYGNISWWLEEDTSTLMIQRRNPVTPEDQPRYVLINLPNDIRNPISTHDTLDAAKIAYLMVKPKYTP